MANKVGIEFYVAGAAAVQRDVHKIAQSVGSVGKMGLRIGGTLYAVRTVSRVMQTMFAQTVAQSPQAVASMGRLNASFTEVKTTLQRWLIPLVEDFAKGLNVVADASKKVVGGIDSIVNAPQISAAAMKMAQEEYRQITGDANAFRQAEDAWGYGSAGLSMPKYPEKWRQIQDLYRQAIPPTEQAPVVTEDRQKAIQEIERLNAALDQQVLVQGLLSEGREHAAEMLQYTAVLERAYGDDMAQRVPLYKQYQEGLEAVAKIRADMAANAENERKQEQSQAAIESYITGLQTESQYVTLINQGRQAEADLLRSVNQFKTQGIELSDQQIGQIREIQGQTRAAEEAYAAQRLAAEQAEEARQRELEQQQRVLDAQRARQQYVGQYITDLRTETQYLQLIRQGRYDEAELLRTINDLRAQGIELSAAELAQIRDGQAQNRRLAESVMQMQSTASQFGQTWTGALEGFAVDGRKASDVARNLAQDLQRLVFRQLVTQPLANMIGQGFLSVMGGMGGGAAPVNAATPGAGGVHGFHGGGVPMYDRPTFTRPVNPGVFAGAGYAHSGLGPGEMPAIIRRDEGVFTPGQMRALGGGSNEVAAALGRIEGLLARQGEKRMIILDRRTGVTRDEVAGVIIDDLDHGGPVATRLGQV